MLVAVTSEAPTPLLTMEDLDRTTAVTDLSTELTSLLAESGTGMITGTTISTVTVSEIVTLRLEEVAPMVLEWATAVARGTAVGPGEAIVVSLASFPAK
jgi:hypothetical protein